MSLYRKYRPETFDDVLGNEAEIESFSKALSKDNPPHSFLLSGPSGCGKTTLARIAAVQLGADILSISELNTADNRGIDTAREIINQMKYTPINGGVRVFIIDECFHGDTIIKTPEGGKKIKDLHIGESVYNIYGEAKIKKVFKNKISLDRIIKLQLSNKKIIYCSKDHKFLTSNGWIVASLLNKKDLILPFNYSIIQNRNRWEDAQTEKYYIKRCKKRKEINGIRLESLEIYERGNNDESFNGIIGDREKDQGFITLFDLAIDGHPSYFAEECLVHNCHMTSKDWQNAMLKPLEDTPEHVYFFLCTTDPGKLLKAIQTRCTKVQVNPLEPDILYRLLRRTAKAEGLEISKEILQEIADNSDRSPRQALVLLEKVIGVDDEKQMRKIISLGPDEDREVIELCRTLLKAKSWGEIGVVLKSITETDTEKIRYAVLGYMNSVLLSSGNHRAAVTIECFQETFYNTGRAGLTLACYQVIAGE